MIIVKIMGGLGNQMFQYAVGYALAEHYKVPLKLDNRFFSGQSLRSYELNVFHLGEHFIDEEDQKRIDGLCFPRFSRLQSWLNKTFSALRIPHVCDSQRGFDQSLFEIKGIDSKGLYLDGFWQSYKYFSSVQEKIKADFSFKAKPNFANQSIMLEMRDSNSICLHVRRGDYVQNADTNALHGTCSLDYYAQSVELIISRVKQPKFFVFSDDPEWSQKNIEIPAFARHISHNVGKSGAEDLRLMKECKHFIIANSSFSWWGAWLSSHDDKIVIAPQNWYAGQDNFSGDLVPDNWLRI